MRQGASEVAQTRGRIMMLDQVGETIYDTQVFGKLFRRVSVFMAGLGRL
jgi:hypothetical protein